MSSLENSQPIHTERSELRSYYDSLQVTLRKADQEWKENPDHRDMVAEGMGARIKERVLRLTSCLVEVALYDKSEVPKHLAVGNDFWFILDDLVLIHKKYKKNLFGKQKPDYSHPVGASNTAWYFHGQEISKKVIEEFSHKAKLPENFFGTAEGY